MADKTCNTPTDEFHTAHLTWLGHLAYGPLRLYRVIPHRFVTRPCPTWRETQTLTTTAWVEDDQDDA